MAAVTMVRMVMENSCYESSLGETWEKNPTHLQRTTWESGRQHPQKIVRETPAVPAVQVFAQ
jgi:hypothetical protein